MRRIAITAGALLGLVLLGLAVLPYVLSVDRFRPLLQQQLQAQIRRPVTFGDVTIRSFPPSLRVMGLTIGEDPAFAKSGKPFATVGDVYVRVSILPLLSGDLDVNALLFTKPVVELVQGSDGRWNFDSLRSGSQGDNDNRIRLLEFEDGAVAVTRFGKPRVEYTHIDLTVREERQVQARANLGPGQTIEYAGSIAPLQGRVDVKDCGAAALLAFANLQTAQPVGGVITGSATIGATTSEGKLTWKDIAFGKNRLRDTLQLSFQSEASGDVVKIGQLEASLGGLALRSSGIYNKTAKTLDAAIQIPRAPIASLAEMASGFGVAFAPGTKVEGTMEANLKAYGAVDAPAFSGTAALQGLQISGGNLRQAVYSDRVSLQLTPDAIRAPAFAMRAGTTQLQATVAVLDYTGKSPRVQAELSTQNSALADLLAMAQAYGVAAAEGVTADGQIALQVRVDGPAKGPLHASGSGSVTGAHIETPQLAAKLAIEKAQIRFEEDAAVIENAAFRLGKSQFQGGLRIRDFQKPVFQLQLAADQIDVQEAQGWVRPGPAKTGAEDPLRVSGEIAVRRLEAQKLVLENVRAKLSSPDGALRLDPLTASLYGGTLAGSVTSKDGAVTLRTKLQNVDADRLLAAVSPLRNVLSGALNADADLRVTPKPNEDLTRSMNGEIQLSMGRGRLLALNLLSQASALGKLFRPLDTPSAGSDLLALKGKLTIVNGVAQTSDLRMDLDKASVLAAGKMGLVDQTLDLRLTTTLNRQATQEAGGAAPGSAGATNAGELVIPMKLVGTFSKPVMAPDPESLSNWKPFTDTVKGILDRFRTPRKN